MPPYGAARRALSDADHVADADLPSTVIPARRPGPDAVPAPVLAGQAAPAREILRLAVPALGALIAEPLFLLADSAIVGHLGAAQLAGLGTAGTALGTLVNVCVFLAYGTTATVARRIGAGVR